MLELNYVVNEAGWTPAYDIRALNTKSPLQLSYKANVFQNTGENWQNVHLKLSTSNPSEGGLKPELIAWYLNFSVPYAMYKSKMAAAPQELKEVVVIQSGDKNDLQASEAESINQYTTTIQTSLNTEFDISLPYTVPSSAKPVNVDIRQYDVTAEYNYAAAPKLDLDAFLLAKAVGWEDFKLLPGEANIFFQGTFVGKSFIDPNSVKDTLSISLGRDKRIVISRDKIKELSSRKMIGSNQRETFVWEISVRNIQSESIQISLEDQVPVSQNSSQQTTDYNNGSYQVLPNRVVSEDHH